MERPPFRQKHSKACANFPLLDPLTFLRLAKRICPVSAAPSIRVMQVYLKGDFMSRQTRNRLFLFVLLLAALAGVLATPAGQSAYAAPCCEQCQMLYEGCLQGTFYSTCKKDPSCCAMRTDNCFWTCVYC
jgi:hypothetical protein